MDRSILNLLVLSLALFHLFSRSISFSSSPPKPFPGSDVEIVNIKFTSSCPDIYMERALAIKKRMEFFFPQMEVTIFPSLFHGNGLELIVEFVCTGSFEVYFNDDLVFSKIKEGRLPSVIEATDRIMQKMPFSELVQGVTTTIVP